MNRWRWLMEYFDLNQRERNGTLVLLCLIFLTVATLYTLHYLIPDPKVDFAGIEKEAAALRSYSDNTSSDSNVSRALLFDFDPNTATSSDLQKLGLSDNTITNIARYRSAGGRFYKPEDMAKIYGLGAEEMIRLKPFIKISSGRQSELIDINTADSIRLLDIRGVGPAFSSRILHLRTSLGAFVNKEQLKDVYGMDEEKYNSILPQVSLSRCRKKLWDINSATAEELKTNPYLGWKRANAIVQYRIMNGPFHSLDDLKKIYALDQNTYHKLIPYLTIKDQ